MSPLEAFHDVGWFKRFTDLNPFTYAFNVIQNWETDALQILFTGAYFLLAVMVQGDDSSLTKGWLTSRHFWLATGPY